MKDNGDKLLNAAKYGSIKAFEDMIEPYQKRIYCMALKLSGDSHKASELSQEVFLQAYRSIKSLNQASGFTELISSVCIKVFRDEINKRDFVDTGYVLFNEFSINQSVK